MNHRRNLSVARFDPFAELDVLRSWPFSPGRRLTGASVPDASQLRGAWSPKVDIHENEGHYMIGIEVPGVDQDDISVECHENVVTIKGEKKGYSEEERGPVRHRERHYGAFSRSFRLPADSNEDAVRATHKNGVLTIEIPKVEPSRPTPVPITSASAAESSDESAA